MSSHVRDMMGAMARTRLFLIGGFLGAGKTTAIARLARHFTDQGLRVGIVTNDQAFGLVDTQTLQAAGFDVGEVAGACFCCKFDELVATAEELRGESPPDIILAEPVGSCTDLVATVIEPLRQLYGDRYETGRFVALLKPGHGQKILRGGEQLGFSPKAAYIFLKQIEEADVVAINKIDRLTEEEREELIQLVSERFEGKEVIAVSAREGDGFEELIEALEEPGAEHERIMDVDYDTYAEGEAELGWLNCQVTLQAAGDDKFDLDRTLVQLVEQLAESVTALPAEIAHLKVFGSAGDSVAVANVVEAGQGVELSIAAQTQHRRAELTVNARVATDPETLAEVVEREIGLLGDRTNLSAGIENMQCFRPGRPVPTHRVS